MPPRGNNGDRPSFQPRRPANTQGRRILNQVDIEEAIVRLSNEIDDLLEELSDRASEMSRAEWSWERYRAKAGLKASAEPGNGPGGRTTVDEREARVLDRDEDELFLNHLATEAFWEVCKERIHAKRDQMKALQTIAANIRAMT